MKLAVRISCLVLLAVLLSTCEQFDFLLNENVSSEQVMLLKPLEEGTQPGNTFFWGAEKFEAQKGKPVTIKHTIGSANLEHFCDTLEIYIKDGSSGKHKVASATIKVDGVEIFGPMVFPLKGAAIGRKITDLTEESVIEVEIIGTSKSSLNVWIEGELLPGGSVVDNKGGTICINDPESTINGLELIIPEGATDETMVITISETPLEAQNPIEQTVELCKPFSINSSSEGYTFKIPLQIKVPVSQFTAEDIGTIFGAYFDEGALEWKELPIIDYNIDEQYIVIETTHFTDFLIFKFDLNKIIEMINSISITARDWLVDLTEGLNDLTCRALKAELKLAEQMMDNEMTSLNDFAERHLACKAHLMCFLYQGIEKNFGAWIQNEINNIIISLTLPKVLTHLVGAPMAAAAFKSAGLFLLKLTSSITLPCNLCLFESSILNPGFWVHLVGYHSAALGAKLIKKRLEEMGCSDNEEPTNGTVTDFEGNVYKTVQIGDQLWMAENLRSTKYNDGTEIPLIVDDNSWDNATTPGYCWYNNLEDNGANYGGLYNWYVVETKKLCPDGWRVPTWTELLILEREYKYGIEQGFAPTLGGRRSEGSSPRYQNEFEYINKSSHLWSSSVNSSDDNQAFMSVYYPGGAYSGTNSKRNGLSVRCIKN